MLRTIVVVVLQASLVVCVSAYLASCSKESKCQYGDRSEGSLAHVRSDKDLESHTAEQPKRNPLEEPPLDAIYAKPAEDFQQTGSDPNLPPEVPEPVYAVVHTAEVLSGKLIASESPRLRMDPQQERDYWNQVRSHAKEISDSGEITVAGRVLLVVENTARPLVGVEVTLDGFEPSLTDHVGKFSVSAPRAFIQGLLSVSRGDHENDGPTRILLGIVSPGYHILGNDSEVQKPGWLSVGELSEDRSTYEVEVRVAESSVRTELKFVYRHSTETKLPAMSEYLVRLNAGGATGIEQTISITPDVDGNAALRVPIGWNGEVYLQGPDLVTVRRYDFNSSFSSTATVLVASHPTKRLNIRLLNHRTSEPLLYSQVHRNGIRIPSAPPGDDFPSAGIDVRTDSDGWASVWLPVGRRSDEPTLGHDTVAIGFGPHLCEFFPGSARGAHVKEVRYVGDKDGVPSYEVYKWVRE